jgi:hypothetical protein
MKTLSAIIITLAFTLNQFSQTVPDGEKTGNGVKLENLLSKDGGLINKSELTGSGSIDRKLYISGFNNSQQKKKKSTVLGVILSALLPGAGEFYGENYLKAGIFFGVEVLAWGTYTYFTVKGDNKTKDFEQFAEDHWNIRRYAQWLVDEWDATGVNPNEPDREVLRGQVNNFESSHFSHQLPEFGTQQYYELIGKYQPYVAGWEDARDASGTWLITQENVQTYQTAMFKNYSIDRGKANDQYNLAKIGPITAILNHILSAADAAWTISAYNKKIKVETGFRMDNYLSPYTLKYEMQPTFNMKVSF